METVVIGEGLSIEIDPVEFQNSDLFSIVDATGGNAIIDVCEIPKLIEALQALQKRSEDATKNH